MHRLLSIACTSLGAGAVLANTATAATIFLSTSTDYVNKCPSMMVTQLNRLYVTVELQNDACGSVTAAEFRLAGFPTNDEGWFAFLTWPGLQPTGDVFNEGVQVSFPCATSLSGAVILLTMDVIGFTPILDRVVSVLGHQNPSDSQFACPVLTLCDDEGTRICAAGAQSRINDSSGGDRCYCNDGCIIAPCPPLAVENHTWSSVKGLYH